MIRGVQKQMIMVKTDKSNIFEAACFLLRNDAVTADRRRSDLLKEANRLIEESCAQKEIKKSANNDCSRRSIATFFLGALSGAFLLGLIWLLCVIR